VPDPEVEVPCSNVFQSYQDTLVTVIGQTPQAIQPDSIWIAYTNLYLYVEYLADVVRTLGVNPQPLPYGELPGTLPTPP
jgi:hypothetical protein